MATLREWIRRLGGTLWRNPRDRELEEELNLHLELAGEDMRRRGDSADAALRAAKVQEGGFTQAMEKLRDQRGVTWLDDVARDLRHAIRTLRQNPGFSAVVVLTLGFGIGINTATFSIVNAVLIRPLGFPEPERLVALHEQLPEFDDAPFSPPDFLDLQRDQRSFEGVAAFANLTAELSGGDTPMRVEATKVSPNLFSVLGVSPLLGRGFAADEDRPGVSVAVLSWGLWQTRYGGSRSIVGQTVTLDRRPHTVIGVMPMTFEFPRRGRSSTINPPACGCPWPGPTDNGRLAATNSITV